MGYPRCSFCKLQQKKRNTSYICRNNKKLTCYIPYIFIEELFYNVLIQIFFSTYVKKINQHKLILQRRNKSCWIFLQLSDKTFLHCNLNPIFTLPYLHERVVFYLFFEESMKFIQVLTIYNNENIPHTLTDAANQRGFTALHSEGHWV